MGKVISSTFNQDVITIDGQSEFLKGLTQGLQNLKKGKTQDLRSRRTSVWPVQS